MPKRMGMKALKKKFARACCPSRLVNTRVPSGDSHQYSQCGARLRDTFFAAMMKSMPNSW